MLPVGWKSEVGSQVEHDVPVAGGNAIDEKQLAVGIECGEEAGAAVGVVVLEEVGF